MKYLLDTHAWVWWNMEPKKLSRKARAAIENAERYAELLLSAISTWEFCKLLKKEAHRHLLRSPGMDGGGPADAETPACFSDADDCPPVNDSAAAIS